MHATDSGSQQSARHGQNDCATVVGRKNWLFADTVAGARASANLYGLIETAKANGIEPGRYLAHLFEVLPTVTSTDQLDALLPQNLDREALSSS